MSEKLKPNFTPVPNVVFDEVMRTLTPAAGCLVFAICRYTYGWGKPQGDEISLKQLQEMTGLTRWGVIRARKQLGHLVTITPGNASRASKYRLNVEISDADLGTLGDQARKLTSHQGSHLKSPIQRKSKESIADRPKKASRAAAQSSKGFTEAMATYNGCFISRFGAKPDIDAREGKLLSGLLKTHGSDEVINLLRYFFQHPPAWVEKNGKFTIPAFKSAYTEILAQSRNGKTQHNGGFVG